MTANERKQAEDNARKREKRPSTNTAPTRKRESRSREPENTSPSRSSRQKTNGPKKVLAPGELPPPGPLIVHHPPCANIDTTDDEWDRVDEYVSDGRPRTPTGKSTKKSPRKASLQKDERTPTSATPAKKQRRLPEDDKSKKTEEAAPKTSARAEDDQDAEMPTPPPVSFDLDEDLQISDAEATIILAEGDLMTNE